MFDILTWDKVVGIVNSINIKRDFLFILTIKHVKFMLFNCSFFLGLISSTFVVYAKLTI